MQSIHTGILLFSLNNIISTIESCCHWENKNISTKKNKLHLCSHFNSQILAGEEPGQCFEVLTISFQQNRTDGMELGWDPAARCKHI